MQYAFMQYILMQYIFMQHIFVQYIFMQDILHCPHRTKVFKVSAVWSLCVYIVSLCVYIGSLCVYIGSLCVYIVSLCVYIVSLCVYIVSALWLCGLGAQRHNLFARVYQIGAIHLPPPASQKSVRSVCSAVLVCVSVSIFSALVGMLISTMGWLRLVGSLKL